VAVLVVAVPAVVASAETVATSVADVPSGAATMGHKAAVLRTVVSVAPAVSAQSAASGVIGRHGAIVLSAARGSAGGSALSVAADLAVVAAVTALRGRVATARVTSSQHVSAPQIGASHVLASAARAASVAASADRVVLGAIRVQGAQASGVPDRAARAARAAVHAPRA